MYTVIFIIMWCVIVSLSVALRSAINMMRCFRSQRDEVEMMYYELMNDLYRAEKA